MNHNSGSTEEVSRGVAVEKLDSVKKWGINTYKVLQNACRCFVFNGGFTMYIIVYRYNIDYIYFLSYVSIKFPLLN